MITLQTDAARSMTLDGERWLMLRSPKMVDLESGKLYDVEIKLHREKRSLDANAYCWVLIGKISEKVGVQKTEIYRSAIKEVGGNYTVVCVQDKALNALCSGWVKNGLGWLTETTPSRIAGCTNVLLYYGSSTYDTKQMSRLIDLIVQEAKQQGIETMTPRELDALKEGWR